MNPSNSQLALTEEDQNTLKKCRQISFWRGSVPLTCATCMAVALAQRWEFFASRPKLKIPAYGIAIFVGYVGGKLAYFNECKQMFLELHDSRIKDQILHYEQMRGFGFPNGSNADANSPVIVNTPVDKEPSGPNNRPMTYAQRREFYRNQERFKSPYQIPVPDAPSKLTPSDSGSESVGSDFQSDSTHGSYFDQDKPTSSFLYDDIYKPRD